MKNYLITLRSVTGKEFIYSFKKIHSAIVWAGKVADYNRRAKGPWESINIMEMEDECGVTILSFSIRYDIVRKISELPNYHEVNDEKILYWVEQINPADPNWLGMSLDTRSHDGKLIESHL